MAVSHNAYSLQAEFVNKFALENNQDEEYYTPVAVAVDNNDRIIVNGKTFGSNDKYKYLGNHIQVFDSNGNFLFKFKTYLSSSERHSPFSYLATDSNNRIIQSESGINDAQIKVFDSNGNFLFKFGLDASDGEKLHGIGSLTTDSKDRIIVSDTANSRIQVFDSTGKFLFKFGAFGSAIGQFDIPRVAVDNNDRIIVSDGVNNRIQVFDSTGKFLFKFGAFGYANDQLILPLDVTVDNKNRIIVLDGYQIKIFDSEGNFLTRFGSEGMDDGQFSGLVGIATNSKNEIIATGHGKYVQVFWQNESVNSENPTSETNEPVIPELTEFYYLNHRLSESPIFCGMEINDPQLPYANQELLQETQKAISEWESKLVEYTNDVENWKITFKTIPISEQNNFSDDCDVKIYYERESENPTGLHHGGKTTSWFGGIYAEIKIYYLDVGYKRDNNGNMIQPAEYGFVNKISPLVPGTIRHEIGHALGLNHVPIPWPEEEIEARDYLISPSIVLENTQFDYKIQRQITPYDVKAVVSLYGEKGFADEYSDGSFVFLDYLIIGILISIVGFVIYRKRKKKHASKDMDNF